MALFGAAVRGTYILKVRFIEDSPRFELTVSRQDCPDVFCTKRFSHYAALYVELMKFRIDPRQIDRIVAEVGRGGTVEVPRLKIPEDAFKEYCDSAIIIGKRG